MRVYLEILDRQGKLKGDLNVMQRTGLQWLMNKEYEEEVEIEKIRLQHQAMAAMQSQEYVKRLLESDDETDEEEWVSPTNLDEVDALLRTLGQNAQPL